MQNAFHIKTNTQNEKKKKKEVYDNYLVFNLFLLFSQYFNFVFKFIQL